MPYEWVKTLSAAPERSGAAVVSEHEPLAELHLWPYRSLPRRGFVTFIAITCGLIAVPLLAVVGSVVLWGILPFVALAVGLVWWAIERSYRDGAILEELRLWPDRIALVRHNPRGPRQDWQANPHWVRLERHATGGPVPHYLTLQGGDRTVEIGAFLSEGERLRLHAELSQCLRLMR